MSELIFDESIIRLWIILEIVMLSLQILAYMAGFRYKQTNTLHIWGAVIAGAVSLAQLGVGMAQKAKAAKLAKANKRPNLEANPYTQEAYDLTGSRAEQGIGDAAMQAYTANNDRNLSSSIDAILKSGGSSNNISDLYDSSNNGLRQLALADDEAKQRNINQFLTVGLDKKANESRDQWYLDKYTPYQDQAALSANMSKDGMDNIWKGVNTAGGAAMNFFDTPQYNAGTQSMRSRANSFRRTDGMSLSSAQVGPGQSYNTTATTDGFGPAPSGSGLFNSSKLYFNTVSGKWERTTGY